MKNPSITRFRSAALIACIVISISAVFLIYRRMDGILRNSYAVWWVADMIVLHLRSNNESWPRSWEDLRDDFEAAVKQSGEPWSFDELRHRVVVDWSLDTKKLKDAAVAGSTFRVVWLSDGTNDHWKRREPNRIIRDYLLSRNNQQPPAPDPIESAQ